MAEAVTVYISQSESKASISELIPDPRLSTNFLNNRIPATCQEPSSVFTGMTEKTRKIPAPGKTDFGLLGSRKQSNKRDVMNPEK